MKTRIAEMSDWFYDDSFVSPELRLDWSKCYLFCVYSGCLFKCPYLDKIYEKIDD